MAACAIATRAGLSRKAALQVALAAAELASNAVRHGGGGEMRIAVRTSPRAGVEVCVADAGPGIAAGGAAFSDGFSEGRRLGPDAPRRPGQGLGIGLGAVRRLMDDVRIVGGGGAHCVIAARWSDG
jgi:serine/threonine-protein kinase RsbT